MRLSPRMCMCLFICTLFSNHQGAAAIDGLNGQFICNDKWPHKHELRGNSVYPHVPTTQCIFGARLVFLDHSSKNNNKSYETSCQGAAGAAAGLGMPNENLMLIGTDCHCAPLQGFKTSARHQANVKISGAQSQKPGSVYWAFWVCFLFVALVHVCTQTHAHKTHTHTHTQKPCVSVR